VSSEPRRPSALPRRPRSAGGASLYDVARLAGVSTASVSRALNEPEKTSAALRHKVLTAADQLAYRPSMAARMLAGSRSRTVAAIVPSLRNDVFARGIEAIEDRLGQAGYTLLLGASNYDPLHELQLARTFVARGVDGVIFMGASHLAETDTLLAERGVAFVNQGVWSPAPAWPCVGFDNREGGAMAARHLLELGHLRLGMVAGVTRDNDRASGRVAGVRDAVRAAGARVTVIEQPYTIEGGRVGLARVLARDPEVTGIVCGNDVLAFGVLFAALDRGIAVPRVLSIMGFDDLELCAALRPSLSSVHVPTALMGRLAAEHILARLDGGMPARATRVELALCIRESTGPAPGR
jgi:LacI family transcriptional regulator